MGGPPGEGGAVRAVLSRLSAEAWLTGALLLLSLLCLVLMNVLVAQPKLLFGRSMSAIAPSLFPQLVLAMVAILSTGYLVARRGALLVRPAGGQEPGDLVLATKFFAVLIFYALTMAPFGFFISSALSLAALSVLAGNRSPMQVLLVSIISPVALYLVATRALAVSLPELSPIEFAYAWVFNR
ncbi:MAG: hypothetical protein AcusKO_21140 [Acuticoccus sp.]